nr:helix-turn-helix transcriptional regulator [Acinetobacter tandoii]
MCEEIGRRLKQARLNLDLTQEEIAESAGISRYVVKQLEKGDGKVQDFMAFLMALDQTSQLDNFLPPQVVSPIGIFKLNGRVRKKASGTKHKTTSKDKINRNEINDDIGW